MSSLTLEQMRSKIDREIRQEEKRLWIELPDNPSSHQYNKLNNLVKIMQKEFRNVCYAVIENCSSLTIQDIKMEYTRSQICKMEISYLIEGNTKRLICSVYTCRNKLMLDLFSRVGIVIGDRDWKTLISNISPSLVETVV